MSDIRECTVQDLADYFAWQLGLGRGKFVVKLDPRGLGFLKLEHHNVNVVMPPDGETCDEQRKVVFVSARF